jgi:hypothetical protein
MPIESVDRLNAVSKPELHARLRRWLAATSEKTIGSFKRPGGQVFVRDGQSVYRLNPDTRRPAVEEYLALVDRYGDDLVWTAALSAKGRKSAVAYGPDAVRIRGFYLYVR